MKPKVPPPRIKPERLNGLAHVFAATRYSIGGLRRLWQETAFRHIILWLPISIALLALAKASFLQYILMLILYLCLIAVEDLNTAIECIVDHLARQWEEFARDAKDLGSLATMCLLCANGLFLGAVLIRAFTLT